MGLTTIVTVNGLEQCFGNLVNFNCDALLWFNQETFQPLLVFDQWLADYPVAQLVLRARLLARLKTAYRKQALNGLTNKIGLTSTLSPEEVEFYADEIEWPWNRNERDWRDTQRLNHNHIRVIGRVTALPAPEQNHRIGELPEISTTGGWHVPIQLK